VTDFAKSNGVFFDSWKKSNKIAYKGNLDIQYRSLLRLG
tara:strand:- start:2384 stop:2500 length:117 start_codon:yes stop_codon:yes gene_type:complete